MVKEKGDWGIAKSCCGTERGQRSLQGVPNDAVPHLASDTPLPGPCHLGTEFGVLAAILTQTPPHLAAAEADRGSGMAGKE